MRHVAPCLVASFLLSLSAAAQTPQDLVGNWAGALDVQGFRLRLVLKVTRKVDGRYEATLDSLDQGASDLPIETLTLENGRVELSMPDLGASYQGIMDGTGTRITGTWTQNGSFPLSFERVKEAPKLNRPQEPLGPRPYREEEVTFGHRSEGGEAVKLAGTLTLPEGEGPYPAAILISGSGQQDRNETIFGHRPFLVIADHLARRGIAVLRYDDRGVGGSTGDVKRATTRDFAEDAAAGLRFLKGRREIDPTRIGLIGHSEGALIAPMVAAGSDDVAFIVLVAGPCVPGLELVKLQGRLVAQAAGRSEKEIAREARLQDQLLSIATGPWDGEQGDVRSRMMRLLEEVWGAMSEEERKRGGGDRKAFAARQVKQLASPWFRFFLEYDPRPALERIRCPVLAVFGERDLQVPPSQNLVPTARTLEQGRSSDATVVKLPGLNHLFQTCRTGAVSEYATIEETFAPIALRTVSDWIVSRFLPAGP